MIPYFTGLVQLFPENQLLYKPVAAQQANSAAQQSQNDD